MSEQPPVTTASRRLIDIVIVVGAALGFAAAWLLLDRLTSQAFFGTTIITDVGLYREIAEGIRAGGSAYALREGGTPILPYPPVSLVAFLVPAAIGGTEQVAYAEGFGRLMLGCGMVMAGTIAAIARSGRVPGLGWVGPVLLVALSPLLIGPVILSRYDLFPAMLTALALAAVVVSRGRLASAIVGVAIATKVYPAVIVPALAIAAWRRAGRREAVIVTAIAGIVAALCVLPFFIAAPEGVWRAFTDQIVRPLQVESLGAAFLVVVHTVTAIPLSVVTSFGSQNLQGEWTGLLALVQSVTLLAALAACWWRLARGSAELPAVLTAIAAAVVAFVAFGKVLSPQYMVWLIPVVALVPGRTGRVAMVTLAAACLLTVAYFPSGYFPYVDTFAAGPARTILLRDLALVVLALELLLPWGRIAAWLRARRADTELRARLTRLTPDAPTLFLLVAVAALLLRALWLNKPDGSLIFDETYYVNAARVINGWAVPEGAPYADAAPFLDPNREHPPLGKALIAASMLLFGDTGLGWRMPSVLAGVVSLIAVWSIVRALGGRASVALLAATVLSLDVLSFVHGRIGTLDMMPVALTLVGARFALVRSRVLAGAALAGLFLALALLVKIPSIYALGAVFVWMSLPAVATWRRTGRIGPRDLLPQVALVASFALVAIGGLWLLDLRYTTFTSPFDHIAHILQYGFALADRYTPDSITSEPWQWLVNDGQFDYLRVNVNTLVNDEVVGSVPSVQFRGLMNPVLIGLAALAIPWAAWRAWRLRDMVAGWGLLWAGANFLPYLVLALISERVMYFYYILPAIPGLAIVSGLFLVRSRMPRVVVAVWVLALIALFIAWFPFRSVPA